jgi:hypothetical protein
MSILLGDFNAKVGRQGILKPTIKIGSSYETSDDNGVAVVNIVTSKILVDMSNMLPHRKICKYT